MSARVMGLVFEHYKGTLAETFLALVLADEAEHSGENIRAVVADMARLSRQSVASVNRTLKKMQDTGWLQCVERSTGGRGKPSVYRIDPQWISLPLGWQPGTPADPETLSKPSHSERVSAPKPYQGERVSDPSPLSLKTLPPIVPQSDGSAVPSATGESEDEKKDQALAGELFAMVQRLLPTHRPPNWKRWGRDVRVMVRAGKTHEQIRALFAWANADEFWARNILSPATLWRQWDKLEIRARAAVKPAAAKPPIDDGLCEDCHHVPYTRRIGKAGHRVCSTCADKAERRAA